MSWVVDTCVLIDVLENDPEFGRASAIVLKRRMTDGLTICPVTMIELSPAFNGNIREQQRFLNLCGVVYHESFEPCDAEAAHSAWAEYIFAKRRGTVPKRPVADIMIGAFALRFEGVITRNKKDFARWFPKLPIAMPQGS